MFMLQGNTPNKRGVKKGALAKITAKSNKIYMDKVIMIENRCCQTAAILAKTATDGVAVYHFTTIYKVYSNAF